MRRRRECLNCDFRFTTYERVETAPLVVIKRNGARETFNREKVLRGLNKACEKTSIGPRKIELIADQIENIIQQKNLREIQTIEIGEIALSRLKLLSEVAYIRFASVYRQFNGISDFVDTLKTFKTDKGEMAAVS